MLDRVKPIPLGSVWSDEPFAPDRDFSQTVVKIEGDRITYCSGSGDECTVDRSRFLVMFPWRHKEFEDVEMILRGGC